ncbi:MAG: peptide deformylase [Planctomycetota bacterium]|jgi:peptide deformylase
MVDIDKCCITHYPEKVLNTSAELVKQIDDTIRRLVDKMIEIMIKHKGVGLAAPQIGVPLRLFIISLDMDIDKVKVFINPTVTPMGELDGMEEGCLSIPGVSTKIRRFKKCRVTATDLDGVEFTDEVEGLYARCLQHEYDHINGITIAERMGSAAKIAHRRQLKKLQQDFEERQNI